MPRVDRRPTAITYKTFLALCSLPTALGLVPLPGSLRSGPDVFGQTAAWAICLGCFISLIGLLWRGDPLDGLTIEQVGLVFIFVGCTLYAVALLSIRWPAAVAVSEAGGTWWEFLLAWLDSISLAFGLSTGVASASVVQNIVIWRYRKRWVVSGDR